MNYRIDNFTLNYSVVIVLLIFIMLFFNYRNILNKINNNIKYIILLNRSLLLLFLLRSLNTKAKNLDFSNK